MAKKNNPAKTRAVTIKKRQDKIKEEIIERLKSYPVISSVCHQVQIDPSTFYRWLKDDNIFAQKVAEANRLGVLMVSDIAQSRVIQGIKDNVPTYILFWLKTRSKDFVEKVTYQNTYEIKCEQPLPNHSLTREEVAKIVEQALLNAARDGNIAAQKFYLEHNHGNYKRDGVDSEEVLTEERKEEIAQTMMNWSEPIDPEESDENFAIPSPEVDNLYEKSKLIET